MVRSASRQRQLSVSCHSPVSRRSRACHIAGHPGERYSVVMGGAIQKPTGFEITARAFASKRRSLALALTTALGVPSLGGVAGASHDLARHLSLGEPRADATSTTFGRRLGRRLAGLLLHRRLARLGGHRHLFDIYERAGGTTRCVSAGQINGNGTFGAAFAGASADGSRVFFSHRRDSWSPPTPTARRTSTSAPAARRPGSRPGRSTATAPSPPRSPARRTTARGSSSKPPNSSSAGDTDSSIDVYERSGGTTTRVSAGQINGNGAFDADFGRRLGQRLAGLLPDRRAARRRRHRQLARTSTSAPAARRRWSRPARSTATAPSTPSAGCASRTTARGSSSRPPRSWSPPTPTARIDVYERSGGTTTLISAGADQRQRRLRRRRAAAPRPTARGSSSTPRRNWSPPTPTLAGTSTSAPAATTTLISAGADQRQRSVPRRTVARARSADGVAGLLRDQRAAGLRRHRHPRSTSTSAPAARRRWSPAASRTGAVAGDAFVQGITGRRRAGLLRDPGTAGLRRHRQLDRHLRALRRHDDAGLRRPDQRQRRLPRRLRGDLGRRLAGLLQQRQSRSSPRTPTPTFDVYERSGGITTLISVGEPAGNGDFAPPSAAPRPTARGSSSRPRRGSSAPTPTPSADLYQRSGEHHDPGLERPGERQRRLRCRLQGRLGRRLAGLLQHQRTARLRRTPTARLRRLRALRRDDHAGLGRPDQRQRRLERVVPGRLGRRHAGVLQYDRGAGRHRHRHLHRRLPALRRHDHPDLSRPDQRQRRLERVLRRAPRTTARGSSSAPRSRSSPPTPIPARTSTSAPARRRRSSRPARSTATAPSPRASGAPPPTARGSSSPPRSRSSPPTPTRASTSTALRPARPPGSRPARSTATAPSTPRSPAPRPTARGSSSRPSSRSSAADTDTRQDVYERSGGTTRLRSAGQINGNGAFDATFTGASADGSRIFFRTNEPLVAADTDAAFDVYERADGTTRLISAGQVNGNGAFDAFFAGASTDGARVFFESDEPLASADTDVATDVYERALGATSLISPGAGPADVSDLIGTSADGSAVFYTTVETLLASDTDDSRDVYGAFIVQVE